MKTLAFIPARGGSKRLLGKNLRLVNGRSMLARAIDSAIPIGACVVSTDDESTADVALACDSGDVGDICVTIHQRPADLATDDARIENAIAHYLQGRAEQPDVIVVLQPTSPLRTAEHVRAALQFMRETDADTVVSVCSSHTHAFTGRVDSQGGWSPGRRSTSSAGNFVEIGPACTEACAYATCGHVRVPALHGRPRTQDVTDLAHENGAIYAVTREHFERTRSLHGSNAVAYVMDRWSSIDVDDEDDLALAEWAERRRGG